MGAFVQSPLVLGRTGVIPWRHGVLVPYPPISSMDRNFTTALVLDVVASGIDRLLLCRVVLRRARGVIAFVCPALRGLENTSVNHSCLLKIMGSHVIGGLQWCSVSYSEDPGVIAVTPGSAAYLCGLVPLTGGALLPIKLERIFDFTD